jgi:hypothetical protein
MIKAITDVEVLEDIRTENKVEGTVDATRITQGKIILITEDTCKFRSTKVVEHDELKEFIDIYDFDGKVNMSKETIKEIKEEYQEIDKDYDLEDQDYWELQGYKTTFPRRGIL